MLVAPAGQVLVPRSVAGKTPRLMRATRGRRSPTHSQLRMIQPVLSMKVRRSPKSPRKANVQASSAMSRKLMRHALLLRLTVRMARHPRRKRKSGPKSQPLM